MNALITGIAGNLGSAVAHLFLQQGARVFGCVEVGDRFDHPGATTHAADLTDERQASNMVQEAIASLSTIEVAVLSVGGFAMGNVAEADSQALDKMLALNFKTAWNVTRPLLDHMAKHASGTIVMIGGRAGLEPEIALQTVAYALSKSLLFRTAEIINAAGHGVRAHVVVPSIMDTPQNREAMPDADFSKWVTPEEVAMRIFKLHSEDEAGSVIKMYGGM